MKLNFNLYNLKLILNIKIGTQKNKKMFLYNLSFNNTSKNKLNLKFKK